MSPVQKSSPAIIQGRMKKAKQFADAADLILDFADDEGMITDAYVTMAVHAGIAASDVICCLTLGEHYTGENHKEATGYLAKARNKQMAKKLGDLLDLKGKAGYKAYSISVADRKKAERTHKALLVDANHAYNAWKS